MKKVFYEKVGKRYKPVKEYDDTIMSAFPKGAHVVVCRPGVTSYMYDVDPDFAPMVAAGKYVEDEMLLAIHEGLELKPKQTLLTERQRALWDELKNSFNDQDFAIYRPAATEAARKGIKALEKEVEKMLSNPAVKLAYDHFITIWKLTKEKQQE